MDPPSTIRSATSIILPLISTVPPYGPPGKAARGSRPNPATMSTPSTITDSVATSTSGMATSTGIRAPDPLEEPPDGSMTCKNGMFEQNACTVLNSS